MDKKREAMILRAKKDSERNIALDQIVINKHKDYILKQIRSSFRKKLVIEKKPLYLKFIEYIKNKLKPK